MRIRKIKDRINLVNKSNRKKSLKRSIKLLVKQYNLKILLLLLDLKFSIHLTITNQITKCYLIKRHKKEMITEHSFKTNIEFANNSYWIKQHCFKLKIIWLHHIPKNNLVYVLITRRIYILIHHRHILKYWRVHYTQENNRAILSSIP